MKKIAGGILLIFGVLIILWGIYSSYQIFQGKKPVPEVFPIQKLKQTLPSKEKDDKTLEEKVGKEIQKIIGEQFSKIIPSEFVPKTFNLLSWSLFMFILIYAGGKLATLGVNLLRND